MISISGKIWKQEKINKNLVEKVKQDYGFGDILSQLIISRNYDVSEINSLFSSLIPDTKSPDVIPVAQKIESPLTISFNSYFFVKFLIPI